jgi:peptidoglycan-N-acetylglucosamine deacetylase
MSLTKIVRVVVPLTVFVWFAFLVARQTRAVIFTNAAINTAREGASGSALKTIHTISARDRAVGLPDSLLPFCRGLHTLNEVALSFDACPTSGKNQFNEAIARILIETKTPATIFLSGRWVEQDTAATKLLASDSLIELGNHSFTHPHMLRLSEDGMRKELDRTQNIISKLTGQTPFLFRAPYGEYNDTLVNLARKSVLATVQFDVESGDPDTTFTAQRLIKWVSERTRSGSIVIMHINNRGWHTSQALPAIIQFLRNKGFTLVKVSDLMKEVSEQLASVVPASSGDNGDKGPSINNLH